MRRVVYLAMLAAALPVANVSAETMAEKQLAQKVGAHLKQSGQLHNYRVGVKLRDGVAYLNGNVANADQRDAAVRLAQQVPGVSHVVSKLEYPIENKVAAKDADSGNNQGETPQPPKPLNRASYDGMSQGASAATQPADGAEVQRAFAPQPAPRQFVPQARPRRGNNMPVPAGRIPGAMPRPMSQAGPAGVQQASCNCYGGGAGMGGMAGVGGDGPMGFVPAGMGRGPSYDSAQMPGYAWPSYASYPNYAALSYPQQYSPTAWPYIGPFYPYPQVPLAWRKVSLEWDDGWWFLDFSAHNSSH